MAVLYTESYLKSKSETKDYRELISMYTDVADDETFDIFLSHSYLDKEVVEGIYLELTRMNFRVYVDWIVDDDLDRNKVTKSSALKIRNRLNNSRSLLLAISENAAISKWIPWELGYVDGNTNKCAIIPVSKISSSPEQYKGHEYLSIYPFIVKEKDQRGDEKLWIVESSSRYVVLNDWIFKSSKPFNREQKIF